MKRFIVMTAVLCFAWSGSYSQQIINTKSELYDVVEGKTFAETQQIIEAFYQGKPQGRGTGYKQWKRAEYYLEPRLYPEGNYVNIPKLNLQAQNDYDANKPIGAEAHQGYWEFRGATDHVLTTGWNGGIGRLNEVAFHPTNPNIIYVGAPLGGLWKTTTGGNSWESLTDGIPTLGVSGIVVNHQNPKNIYILTGDGDGTISQYYSNGVYKTTNGGRTWMNTGCRLDTFPTSNYVRPYELKMHPSDTNILYAATNKGIWKTVDAGVNWTVDLSDTMDNRFYDFEFKPGSPSTMYCGGTRGVWRKVGNNPWSLMSIGIPTDTASNGQRIEVSVSSAQPTMVYAMIANTSNNLVGIYRSSNSGLTWSLRYNGPNLLGAELGSNDSQATYDLALEVSPTNSQRLILGGINTWRSTNGGLTWQLSSHWREDTTTQYTHADIHELRYNGSNLYCCSDGGIYRSTDDGVTWSDIGRGLGISQFYHITGTPQNTNMILGGTQDNGCNLRMNDSLLIHVRGADGMMCMIDPTNSQTMYTSSQRGFLSRSFNGGANWSPITPTSTNWQNWVTPVAMDPTNSNTLFSAKGGFWRSTNQGSNWTNIGAHPRSFQIVDFIQASSVPNNMYLTDGRKVFRNTGILQTTIPAWDSITNGLPVGQALITDITINPKFSGDVFVTFSGFSAGNKVWRSTNANTPTQGNVTWTNISGSLPNIPINTITYHEDGGVNSSDRLYIGTDIGVFYRDNSIGDWVPYSNGLPSASVRELYINYSDQTLWAGTFGRGIWSSDLYNDCPTNYNLTDGNNPSKSGTQEYEADNRVTSSRDYDGGVGTDIEYRAGFEVVLTPGFELEKHSEGRYYIGPCQYNAQGILPRTGTLSGMIPGAVDHSIEEKKKIGLEKIKKGK